MRSGPFRIAVFYITVALTWIALSDRALFIFNNTLNPEVYLWLSSGKGFLFVIITGFFLYKLILADKKKLIESESQYRSAADENKMLARIITRVNNMIIVTDKNNLITWVNKAVEDFAGYQFFELVGKTPASVFTVLDSDKEALMTILEGKKALASFSTDVSCYTKSGESFCVAGEFTPLFDDDDNHIGYISVYSNITWRKQKEDEITRQNDKLKEVAWLSSHEVRRPLANIMGLTSLIKATSNMDEKIKILDHISSSAKELDAIVHEINSKIVKEFEDVD